MGGVLPVHKDIVKDRREVSGRTVLEGVGQVQLEQRDKVGEYARMAPRRIQRELVEVEYEALHVLHVMVGLAPDLAYLIVRHVDNLQIRQSVEGAEYIPR